MFDDERLPDPTEPAQAHRRLAYRFSQGMRRLRAPAEADAPAAWNRTMTVILLCALVLTGGLTLLDGSINTSVREADNALRSFMIAWTDVARSQWYLVPAGALVLAAGLADWGSPDSRSRRVWSNIYIHALFAFAAIAGALMVTNVIKQLVGRGRPPLYDEHGAFFFHPLAFEHAFTSFPSGHSTTAASVTTVLMLWFPRLRFLFVPLGIALAASRSPAEAHYPSDIAAGLAVGFLFTILLARWLARRSVAFRFQNDALCPVPTFRIGQDTK